jgi:hypothetical protein
LLARICHWNRDRGCESAQLVHRLSGTLIGVIEFIVLAHRWVHAHLGVGETR